VRIVGIGFHTTYQYELAQIGEGYSFEYLLSLWDHDASPQPGNVVLPETLEPLTHYDAILAHSLDDFLAWKVRLRNEGSDVPLVASFHSYPPHWDECQHRLPLPLHRIPAALRGHPKVFISRGTEELWGCADEPESVVISHAIDGARWTGYRGDERAVLTVCNMMWLEDRYRGGSLFDIATEGLPRWVIGNNPGRSVRAASAEVLQEAYRSCRVFLWTGLWAPTSFAPLEAMATGMPLVTVWTPDWGRLIQNGVNGFVCQDAMGLRARCQQLLADPGLATEVGVRGRRTVLEHFAPEQFRQKWRQVIDGASRSSCPR
jgi:hypothetical protein